MRRIEVLLLILLVGSPWVSSTRGQDYQLPWPPGEKPQVDLSYLLQKPAGANGFLTVRNGHLATAEGDQLRIWGINLTAGATVPAKREAPDYARFFAQRGINCVRFHFLDLPAPRGIIDGSREDTGSLDPEMLDQFDFFVAELKKNGIYANLNLNVGRKYRTADGVRDWQHLGYAKGLTYFDERLIELQKEYARKLLSHYNPYTGSAYRSEPAIAIIELVNENSIVESWFSGRLLGENRGERQGTWIDITKSYAEDLTHRYNVWLIENLTEMELERLREEAGVGSQEQISRLRPEEFEDASEHRFRTEAMFYMNLEKRYFWMMKEFLREEVGAESLLVGTSDHNHAYAGYALLSSTQQLDIVDGHTYWQHPSYSREPDWGRATEFWIPNTAMVDDPFNSTVVELSRSAVSGRPYIVSEVNHPFPNQFAAEGIPILAAYGLFQDWDGIFWYTLEHDPPSGWEERIGGHFDLAPDPIKMTQLAAGALLFLRGDVKRARNLVPRAYSAEQIWESVRQSALARPYFTTGFSPALPLRHATRIVSFDHSTLDYPQTSTESPLVSDTGELKWVFGDKGEGLVTVETERMQAIVGHLRQRHNLPHLAVELKNRFAAVTLTSLDGRTLAESETILLNTATSVSNTGMEWNEEKTSLISWGDGPTRIEPVSGTVTVRGLRGAEAVEVVPLKVDGEEMKDSFRAVKDEDGWSVRLEDAVAPWYLLRVIRE